MLINKRALRLGFKYMRLINDDSFKRFSSKGRPSSHCTWAENYAGKNVNWEKHFRAFFLKQQTQRIK